MRQAKDLARLGRQILICKMRLCQFAKRLIPLANVFFTPPGYSAPALLDSEGRIQVAAIMLKISTNGSRDPFPQMIGQRPVLVACLTYLVQCMNSVQHNRSPWHKDLRMLRISRSMTVNDAANASSKPVSIAVNLVLSASIGNRRRFVRPIRRCIVILNGAEVGT